MSYYKGILTVGVLLAAVVMFQGCSKSSKPEGREIIFNEEIREGQIAFKVTELREMPSGISITMAGEKKPTQIHNFKVKGVIKNESSEALVLNKAFFVSPMSIGVTTFSVTSAMERHSVALAHGETYIIEDEISSSTKNSVVFSVQIERADGRTEIIGPYRIRLIK